MFTRQITRVALTGLALAVLLGVFAPGCGDDKQQAKPQQTEPPVDPRLVGLRFTDDELPRLDSSTSARPLIIWIASHLTGRECLWSPIPKMMFVRRSQIFPVALRPDVTAGMYDEASRSESPFKGMANLTDTDFLGTLSLHGTHGSYVQLIEDKADLIIVAREPSKDELTLAKEKNVELDVRAVALDAFVFLRNVENTVTDLTAEQIRDIFRGNITNWKDLDGPDQDIKAFTRNRNSGSQETMVSLVMKGEATIEGRNMMSASMAGPYNSLGSNATGIGYTFYYYNAFISPNEAIKTFAVNGVAPTSKTIADGRYPFVTEVYVVTRKALDPDSNAALLRDWLGTPEGQAVVAESSYVPLP
ncbi:hypothetical protein LCGC14_0550740 [marine sediment metagenome]|uniref:PBP domain-containing protein n=1 Tax=marine sediment metagenome TaxID=412755 RepID=A0A0F9UBC4_9ZZZZ|nr:hypothetical protein [Phycisphaerae bacterium]HDZ42603.1 hypothetical protein [Phycisphaerae bacterium]